MNLIRNTIRAIRRACRTEDQRRRDLFTERLREAMREAGGWPG